MTLSPSSRFPSIFLFPRFHQHALRVSSQFHQRYASRKVHGSRRRLILQICNPQHNRCRPVSPFPVLPFSEMWHFTLHLTSSHCLLCGTWQKPEEMLRGVGDSHGRHGRNRSRCVAFLFSDCRLCETAGCTWRECCPRFAFSGQVGGLLERDQGHVSCDHFIVFSWTGGRADGGH